MKQRICEMLVLVFLLFVCGRLNAGIQVFSYQDDQGHIFVVDSLEKIPEQYRNQSRKEFIPSFKKLEKKPVTHETTVVEVEPDVNEPDQEKSYVRETATVVPPPEEDRSAEIASATAIMAQIKQIQLNNERIHMVSMSMPSKSRPIYILHNENIVAMRNLSAISSLVWDKGEAWKAKTLQVISELKTLQYTISKWIQEDGEGLRQGLPSFLLRFHGLIIELDALLAKAVEAEKANDN